LLGITTQAPTVDHAEFIVSGLVYDVNTGLVEQVVCPTVCATAKESAGSSVRTAERTSSRRRASAAQTPIRSPRYGRADEALTAPIAKKLVILKARAEATGTSFYEATRTLATTGVAGRPPRSRCASDLRAPLLTVLI
jgi:hypothetical protein